jgi:hypothetical protein
LDRTRDEDNRSQQQPGKETEESGQGNAEVIEEFPSQIKLVLGELCLMRGQGGKMDLCSS